MRTGKGVERTSEGKEDDNERMTVFVTDGCRRKRKRVKDAYQTVLCPYNF